MRRVHFWKQLTKTSGPFKPGRSTAGVEGPVDCSVFISKMHMKHTTGLKGNHSSGKFTECEKSYTAWKRPCITTQVRGPTVGPAGLLRLTQLGSAGLGLRSISLYCRPVQKYGSAKVWLNCRWSRWPSEWSRWHCTPPLSLDSRGPFWTELRPGFIHRPW